MHIENNTLVYDVVKCWHCKNTGKLTLGILCPLMHKPVKKYPGHVCPHCKSKNSYSHGSIGKRIEDCYTCKGQGTRLENNCDSMPHELYASLEFRVLRHNRDNSFNESYLGLGCVYSCEDYGRNQSMSDAELIAKVKEHSHVQACSIATRDNTMPSYVGIFCTRNGYSVRPVYELTDTVKQIANERGVQDALNLGTRLASAGLNGTILGAFK